MNISKRATRMFVKLVLEGLLILMWAVVLKRLPGGTTEWQFSCKELTEILDKE